ncbi:MAG: hypothetical protein Q8Q14_03265 [Gemmatimonadales bacterium]|nr:hypothetical protein [Gemmatimonadales bacterium]
MADVAGHSPLTPIGIGGSYTITAGGDYVKAVDLAATGMQVPEGVPVRVVITGEISVTPTPGLLVFCQTEFFYPLCTGQWAELINVRSIPPSGAGIDWWPGTANILVAWNGGAATQPDAGGNSVLSGPAPAEAEVWAGREQFGCWYDDDITHTGSGACFSYGGGFTVTVRAEDGSDPGGGSGGGSGPKLSVAVDPAGVGTQGGVVTATAVLAAGATISDERWYFVPDSIATLPGDTITVPDPIVTSAPAGAASRTSGSEPGFSALSSITNLRPSSPPPLRAVAAGPGARIIHVMGSAPLGSVTACDDIESCAVPIPRGGTVVLAATVDGVALSASQHVDAGSTTAARLRLECTESVTRGQVATCAASVDPPATPFPITAWSFTPSSGSIGEIVRPGDVASTTWSGMMAAGGTLQVSATIAGATQNASATIQVEPRSPAALAVAFVISRNDPGELPARPTSEHDFGQTGFLLQVNANTIEYITDGPNTGLSFFNAVPVTVEITVSVNTVALAVGSDFWQLQDPFARPPTIGIGACNRSDVTRIIPLVEAHEGTARNSPNSHVKEYMDAFEPEARAFFEPIVAAELAGPLDDLTRISNRATAVSKQRVDNSLANPFRLNCRFKYF